MDERRLFLCIDDDLAYTSRSCGSSGPFIRTAVCSYRLILVFGHPRKVPTVHSDTSTVIFTHSSSPLSEICGKTSEDSRIMIHENLHVLESSDRSGARAG